MSLRFGFCFYGINYSLSFALINISHIQGKFEFIIITYISNKSCSKFSQRTTSAAIPNILLLSCFTGALIATETYPLFIVSGLGVYIALFQRYSIKSWLLYSTMIFETIFVFYFVYGFGKTHTFASDLSLNYNYIYDTVYGHPVKFAVGILCVIFINALPCGPSFNFI